MTKTTSRLSGKQSLASTPNSKPAATPATIAPDPFVELDAALRDLVTDHEALLSLAKEHRRAIAAADVSAMHRCLEEQDKRLGLIRQHEARRQNAIRAIQGGVAALGIPAASANNPTRLAALAQRAAEPLRSRLTGLGERLRELLNAVQAEHNAVREAAETLSSHMEGLMRQVCRHLSHAGTYGRSAAIDTRTPVVTVLDLRS